MPLWHFGKDTFCQTAPQITHLQTLLPDLHLTIFQLDALLIEAENV